MRRACVMMVIVLLGCGAAQAQSAITTPGVGATSPLGILGSSSSSGTGGTGVPLGATEIDPGGLSPAAGCSPTGTSMFGTSTTSVMSATTSGPSAMASAASTNPGSTFDGGGLAGTGSATSSCTSGAPNVMSSGIASPLSGPSSNLTGGTIPLGATELDGGGLSPMITVPAPTLPTPGATTCAGSTIGSDPTATSMNLGTTLRMAPGC